ncbi:uncharacterized protein LOC131679975 [Topomyia yanbarensis]|uniref:uncharacterized protein LOC131679975 n=1 Tax=Topomyia yanbarensis TaxID=2498891 RepID=UPI00273AE1CE|nr:uncharacterized protein LOC131679975 [Topomyia yanbarensis]
MQYLLSSTTAPSSQLIPSSEAQSSSFIHAGMQPMIETSEFVEFTNTPSGEESTLIQLPDGTIARVVANDAVSANVGCPDSAKRHAEPCCQIGDICNRLDRIERELILLKHVPSKIDTVLKFSADINKFLISRTQVEQVSIHQEEDFSACQNYLTINDKQDLVALEQKLTNRDFAAKLLRYCESLYNLSGKRGGENNFQNVFEEDSLT